MRTRAKLAAAALALTVIGAGMVGAGMANATSKAGSQICRRTGKPTDDVSGDWPLRPAPTEVPA